jgi:4-hydroxy-tetrahydrodipicolinate reductase
MKENLALGIHGAGGRMGQTLKSCMLEDESIEIAYEHYSKSSSLDALCDLSKVVIDFSSKEGAMALLQVACAKKTSTIICSSGFSEDEEVYIEKCALEIPLLRARNTSLGATLLERLTELSSKALPQSFESSILDIHHKHKKDSPSGTAIGIQKATSNRKSQIASIRVGEVIGEHAIFFFGPNEEIVLSHKVTSRLPFAIGAIAAAKWLASKPQGRLYTMKDIFNF